MRSVLRALAKGVLVAGFAVASVWSARLSWADYWFRGETVPGTEKAIAATPGQADLYVRLAQLQSEENAPGAVEALQHAVALRPSDGRSWIDLGLLYEAEGKNGPAEQCLLRAAGEDKQYLPRWTLANYYFRRDDTVNFWLWAKESAAMISGDPLPLFRLCGRVVEDGQLIDRLEIRRADVLSSYVYYLLGQNRLDLTAPSIRRLLEANREVDVAVLLATCDRQLGASRIDDALEIWNGLADRRRIEFGRLVPESGTVLTNGDFKLPPTSQGFDWRLPTVNGVNASSEENSGLRITFSGRQPERTEPLVQLVPVQENSRYQLRFQYRTSGIRPGAGLHWRVADSQGKALNEGESLSAEKETLAEITFATPPGCRLLHVSLNYERAPGTTRIEGFAVLRTVALNRVASQP